MDVFKTKPGISESIPINEENFTEKTKKQQVMRIVHILILTMPKRIRNVNRKIQLHRLSIGL